MKTMLEIEQQTRFSLGSPRFESTENHPFQNNSRCRTSARTNFDEPQLAKTVEARSVKFTM